MEIPVYRRPCEKSDTCHRLTDNNFDEVFFTISWGFQIKGITNRNISKIQLKNRRNR